MKTTLRALAPRMCILLGVASFGCAQVLGIDGWTEGGAGGQGGDTSTSRSVGPSGSMMSSSGNGGQGNATATAASTGSGTCIDKDMPCQDHSECCSLTCEGNVCASCGPLGQGCTPDSCCGELVCGPGAQCCKAAGGQCGSITECCSQMCVAGFCVGVCLDQGQPCGSSDQCCVPFVCQGNVCTAPCASQGHPCTLASECCTGLTCLGGMCAVNCTSQWQPCASNTECCSGLECPSGICSLNKPNQMESEPNNSPTTADPVYTGKVCGKIEPVGDHDWYAIDLPDGVSVDATVVAGPNDLCGPSGPIDSEVEIRSSAGQLAFNDDINTMTNYCSSAYTTIPGSSTYYVRVSASQAFAPMSIFSYCLTLTVF